MGSHSTSAKPITPLAPKYVSAKIRRDDQDLGLLRAIERDGWKVDKAPGALGYVATRANAAQKIEKLFASTVRALATAIEKRGGMRVAFAEPKGETVDAEIVDEQSSAP